MADLRRVLGDAPGPKFLQFQIVFGENLAKSYVSAPPGELAPPPLGNPGSATDLIKGPQKKV